MPWTEVLKIWPMVRSASARIDIFHRDAIRLEVQVSDVSNRLERLEKRFETVQIN